MQDCNIVAARNALRLINQLKMGDRNSLVSVGKIFFMNKIFLRSQGSRGEVD